MVQELRIKQLDNRLANQIAAGEVVERPASVVKELMENSIDAEASLIEVEIERGGTRNIRVTDNGLGICKADLSLALTRHATSKISCTEDLAAIQSLGFRGEALASISSVSRLTLTSRTSSSELAWQAIAEGRDMAVDIQPAAAAQGTRIEVADLFFNTPARQKFLRTEKTEFNHIEEVFKRHALANFSISFILKHNHKVVKRVPACGESSQYLKRISVICGKAFADNCISFECQHEAIRLNGWLGRSHFHRSESDIQYVFINGRPVKDKTLNHAIRQSYEGLLPQGRMAAYIIYLTLNPQAVDVNVHPTKHEVRFGEQRLIHDLLVRSISEALHESQEPQLFEQLNTVSSESANNKIMETAPLPNDDCSVPDIIKPADDGDESTKQSYSYYPTSHSRQSVYRASSSAVPASPLVEPVIKGTSVSFDERGSDFWLIPAGDFFWICWLDEAPVAVNMQALLAEYLLKLLNGVIKVPSRALLFPQALTLSTEVLEDYQTHQILERLGFICSPESENQILVKKVPHWLNEISNAWIFEQLPLWLAAGGEKRTKVCCLISQSFNRISAELARLLYQQLLSDKAETEAKLDISAKELCIKAIDVELIRGLFK